MAITLAAIEDLALQTWININPSTQWANQQIEPFRGLPFGKHLHATRSSRPRSLTLPLERPDETWWHRVKALAAGEDEQTTSSQDQSAFLSKLPFDIRMMIYDMVLGGDLLHLTTETPRGRIRHRVCQCPEQTNDEAHYICSDLSPPQTPGADKNNLQETFQGSLLPLLLTCRKIYSEAIDTLYSANTFEFTQHFAAFTFLCQQLPPQRLPRIRRLRLHMRLPRHPAVNSRTMRDWQDLWHFFQHSLCGLQSLHLRLQMLQPMEEQIESTKDDEAEDWLRPIVVMAVDAARQRGCEMHMEVRSTTLDPAKLFTSVSCREPQLGWDALLHKTCAALHEKIRVSLG